MVAKETSHNGIEKNISTKTYSHAMGVVTQE